MSADDRSTTAEDTHGTQGVDSSNTSDPDSVTEPSRFDLVVLLSTGLGSIAFGVLLAVAVTPRLGVLGLLAGGFFVTAGVLALRGGLDDSR
jgi:hypothetical protein